MKTLKKLLFWITSYLLRFVLFATITAAVALAVVGKSSDIKDVLNQTHSYDRFVPAVIAANKAGAQTADSLNYDDPQVAEIFTSSFPASDLRHNSEMVVDDIYAWLNGPSKNLQFKVDFTQNKAVFADKLSAYVIGRLNKLPKCTEQPESVNPLTIQCKPGDYNAADVQKSYRDQLFTSDTFLSKTVLTEKDLPKNTDGKSLPQQFSFAPTAWKLLQRSPIILGSLLALLSFSYIFLSPRRRRGISGFGSILISAGISLAIFPIFYDYILPHFTSSYQIQSGTTGTQAIMTDVITHVTQHFDSLFITIGIQLAIGGLTIYLLERVTRRESSRYKNVEFKSGVETSIEKPQVSPKSLRGKLNNDNIPLQSSEGPAKQNPKKVSENKKYRELYSKKGL